MGNCGQRLVAKLCVVKTSLSLCASKHRSSFFERADPLDTVSSVKILLLMQSITLALQDGANGHIGVTKASLQLSVLFAEVLKVPVDDIELALKRVDACRQLFTRVWRWRRIGLL